MFITSGSISSLPWSKWMSSMIGHRYCQFIQTFIITINTAFSSPQEYQGQVNDFHLVFNAPFESFDAAASSKDPINAIPKQANYPSSSVWNPDVMAALEAQGAKDKNLATAPNSAADLIGAPSSSESLTSSGSIATTNPSQNQAGSESSFLSADDRSLQQEPAPSLPSSATKLAFELDNVDLLPFPIPLIKYFPIRLPEFHDDGTRQWLPEQKQPSCGTFYLFCCEQGPPINGMGRASPRTKDHIGLPKRRRKCKRYNKYYPQCYFPENIFCCLCRDGFHVAYECYNFYWQNDPAFQNQPVRDPRQLPKPRTNPPPPPSTIDPNPEEPLEQQNQQQQQRRRRGATSSSSSSSFSSFSSFTDFSAAASDQSQLYADKSQLPKRVKEMCTNDYLRGIGVTPHPYSRDP